MDKVHLPCNLCDNIYNQRRKLFRHMRNDHGKRGKVSHTCKVCKDFSLKQSLQTHQNEVYLTFNFFIVVSVGNPLQGIMTLSYIREMFTRPREYLFE